MRNKIKLQSPIGILSIEHNGTAVTALRINPENRKSKPPNSQPHDSFSQIIFQTLNDYFNSAKRRFDLPLAPKGTKFQKKIWALLTQIEVGKTITYGELAKKAQSHPRAVASACRENPVAILIPCHRVVSQKDLGGFMGAKTCNPLKIKQWLLKHESTSCTSFCERRFS